MLKAKRLREDFSKSEELEINTPYYTEFNIPSKYNFRVEKLVGNDKDYIIMQNDDNGNYVVLYRKPPKLKCINKEDFTAFLQFLDKEDNTVEPDDIQEETTSANIAGVSNRSLKSMNKKEVENLKKNNYQK